MSNNNDIEKEPQVDVKESTVDEVLDVEVLEAVEADDVDALKAELASVKELLVAAEKKAEESYELALRTKAEADNIKRRTESDVSNARKFSIEKFAQELLPVMDSLQMGLAAVTEENATVEKFREGSEMTVKMFLTAIEKFGVEVVDPEGEKFNPDFHQAMSMLPSEDLAPNTVMNVFQKGYTLQGRLMRPAMVIVSKAAEAPPESPTIDETV